MRRERGGAMIFVLMLLSGVAAVMLATSSLTYSGLSTEQRREAERAAWHAFEGLMDKVMDDVRTGAIAGSTSLSGTLGGLPYTGTVVDNSVENPWTWKVSITLTSKGRKYLYSQVIPKSMTRPNPYTYALFCHDDFLPMVAITTGADSENGDIASNGDIWFLGYGSTIHGNVEAGDSILLNANIKGNPLASAPYVSFPNAASNLTYWNARTRSVYNWPSNANLGNYELWYCSGDLDDVEGTLSGKGTVFVTGDLTITHHLRYANTSSEVAFVVLGNVYVDISGSKDLAGYFYVNGTFVASGGARPNLERGGVVARQVYLTGSTSIVNDPFLWKYPAETKKLRLPGYWP